MRLKLIIMCPNCEKEFPYYHEDNRVVEEEVPKEEEENNGDKGNSKQ